MAWKCRMPSLVIFGRALCLFATIALLAVASVPSTASAKTYLVNGILSATPIGYGFKNLKKKIPNASLFLMVTGLEAGGIRSTIVADIRKRHAANPSEQFSLAGISAGANVVLQVAREVAREGIPIFYIGVVESSGGAVPSNVAIADNFICTGGSCNRNRLSGSGATDLRTFDLNDGHINLGNNPTVHSRVVQNAR